MKQYSHSNPAPDVSANLGEPFDLQHLHHHREQFLAALETLRNAAADAPGAAADLLQQACQALADLSEANIQLSAALQQTRRELQDLRADLRIEGEPLNLVLFRHGRSVGNDRDRILALGEDHFVCRQYLETPNYQLRLLTLGRQQAEAAGRWLRSNLDFVFDAAFCPDFVRSQETAGIVGREISLAETWRESGLFGERNWGSFEDLDPEERSSGYDRRTADPRHWAPPQGESMQTVELGARLALGTMHRKYNLKNVLVSTHGERLNAFRSIIERLPLERLRAVTDEGPPNCGIVHYTRRDPETGQVAPHWSWLRLICPWDLSKVRAGERWDGRWRRIERPSYTSDQLLELVSRHPQIFDR